METAVNNLEHVELQYYRNLGTPFGIGEKIGYGFDNDDEVVGYNFNPANGLNILTLKGQTFSDYEVAAPERKAAINRFFDWARQTQCIES